jgi:hypothetical protein
MGLLLIILILVLLFAIYGVGSLHWFSTTVNVTS